MQRATGAAYVWRSIRYLGGRYLLRRPFMVANGDSGRRFKFKTEDVVGRLIFKRGVFEEELGEFVLGFVKLSDGDVAVDVGANLGWYSVLLDRLADGTNATVLSFEPDPLNFELLAHNAKLNGATHLHLVRKAVSDRPGVARLYRYASKNLGRHSLLPINEDTGIEVETVTLDGYLAGLQIAPGRVRFVKIDVEGLEFEVLRGMTRVLEARPLVVAEFSPKYMRGAGIAIRDFVTLLESRGYRPHRIGSRGLIPIDARELEDSVASENLVWQP